MIIRENLEQTTIYINDKMESFKEKYQYFKLDKNSQHYHQESDRSFERKQDTQRNLINSEEDNNEL